MTLTFDFKDKELSAAVTDEFEESFTRASSFIGTVTFFLEDSSMIIDVAGKPYAYCDVPFPVYETFKNASSKGRFFNKNIKGLEC